MRQLSFTIGMYDLTVLLLNLAKAGANISPHPSGLQISSGEVLLILEISSIETDYAIHEVDSEGFKQELELLNKDWATAQLDITQSDDPNKKGWRVNVIFSDFRVIYFDILGGRIEPFSNPTPESVMTDFQY